MKKTSYFDGGLLQLIGWTLLGIYYNNHTWDGAILGHFMVYGWKANHTVVEARRLTFDGKAVHRWVIDVGFCFVL